MAATTEDAGNGKDANLLAGLCYVPLFGLSIIVSIYVILAKKGGKYAKFHALQSLLLMAVLFVVFMPLQILMMSSMFGGTPQLENKKLTEAETVQWMMDFNAKMLQAALPMFVLSFLVLVFDFYLAYRAFVGSGVRLPVIAGLAKRFV